MPCEASTRGGSELVSAKSTLFSLSENRTSEARAVCGIQYHEGENLFCFLFSHPMVVGLSLPPHINVVEIEFRRRKIGYHLLRNIFSLLVLPHNGVAGRM